MQIKIYEVIQVLSSHAPLNWQEDYDNCGLLVGDQQTIITGVLTCLDVTLDVIEEAIEKKANLIVAHHPIIYKPLKKLSSGGFVENIILKAIKNDIAIYVIHTNLDNALHRGINETLGKLIGINNGYILQPKSGLLSRITCYLTENVASLLLPPLNLLQPHAISYQPGIDDHATGQLTVTLFNHKLTEATQVIDSISGKAIFKEITNLNAF